MTFQSSMFCQAQPNIKNNPAVISLYLHISNTSHNPETAIKLTV